MNVNALLHEGRHAIRRLAKSPGYLLATVLMLSIGAGSTVFMFGAIQAYILSEPPYPDPQELLYIQMADPVSGRDEIEVPQPVYLRWKEQAPPGRLAGFYLGTVNLSGEARPERLEGAFVTTDAFEVLQVPPAMGRGFVPADAVPGAPPVVVISHALWLNRYLGAPDIIGRTIRVNARPATIIGVMPEDFAFPWLQDVWLPVTHDPNVSYREAVDLEVFARLSGGAGIGAMHDALAATLANVEDELPAAMRQFEPRVVPYVDEFISDWTRRTISTLSVCVMFVLFIACVNVAGLMTARGIRDRRESAIRNALGASRGRLVARVLLESLLVSVVAAGIGTLLSHWGNVAIDRYLAFVDELPAAWVAISYDWRMLSFIAGTTFMVALVSGLAPALRAGRTDPVHDLKEGGGAAGGRASRAIRWLVSAEIALSCVLLVATGLMLRSLDNALDVDIGAETENVLTGRVGLFAEAYSENASRLRFVERLEAELSGIPGVVDATVATGLPAAVSDDTDVRVDGTAITAENPGHWTRYVAVTPGYFDMFGITLREGRTFGASDDAQHPDVAVVTQAFVDEYLPDGNPVGRQIRMEGEAEPLTIVGVADNVIQDEDDMFWPPRPVLYRPVAQADQSFFSFAIRTAGDPYAFQDAVRAAMQRVDPDIPVYWLRTLDAWIVMGTSMTHLLSALLGVCTVFAVLLAGIGLYSVMAYAVNQRTREISVRRALGADDVRVVLLFIRENLLQLGVALALGLALAAGFAQVLASNFTDVSSLDPPTYLAVVGMLVSLIAIASFVPTRRALRVQPQEALRSE